MQRESIGSGDLCWNLGILQLYNTFRVTDISLPWEYSGLLIMTVAVLLLQCFLSEVTGVRACMHMCVTDYHNSRI